MKRVPIYVREIETEKLYPTISCLFFSDFAQVLAFDNDNVPKIFNAGEWEFSIKIPFSHIQVQFHTKSLSKNGTERC